MKIYISGKITGLHKRDYRGKFKAAANRLRMLGHTVVDPSRLDVYELTYAEYMAVDTTLLGFCDAIYMLDNWENSNGAKLEKEYAESLGLKVLYESEERDEKEERKDPA